MTAACPADAVDGANMVSPSMISHPFTWASHFDEKQEGSHKPHLICDGAWGGVICSPTHLFIVELSMEV